MHSSWLFPQSRKEAESVQKEMAERVIAHDVLTQSASHIAGMDLSNTPFDPEHKVFGAAVVLAYPSLEREETAIQIDRQDFPYIPGLLGFRETLTLVRLYEQLVVRPEVIMVDGHGISHPRGLGVASHLGVLLDIPTIGVAKSILVGAPSGSLGEEAGSAVPLVWKGKEIGMVLRTKRRCRPLIVSVGHKVSLQTAVHLVLTSLKGYRLPEPTRHAHNAAGIARFTLY